jgi:S1-C subfamily serine protease
MEVIPEGPADDAGLEPGDLITEANGAAIRRMGDFAAIMQTSKPGDRVTLKYQRGGTLKRPGTPAQTVVTLGTRPSAAERPFDFGRIGGPEEAPSAVKPRSSGGLLGLRMGAYDEAVGRRLRIPATRGVLVTSVTPGSPAERAGIVRDTVIVSIDGQQVAAPDELSRAVAAAGSGATVELQFYQGAELQKKRIVLGGAARPGIPPSGKPAVARNPVANPPAADPRTQELTLEQQVELLQRQVLDLHWRLRTVEEQLKQAQAREEK